MSGAADLRSPREPARRTSLRRGVSVWAPLGALFSALLALGGCQDLCTRNSDCPPGLVCQPSGMCDAPPIPLPGQTDASAADIVDDELAGDHGDDGEDGDIDAGPE